MRLARKFDRRLMQALSLHAVWEPGSSIALGDVLVRQEGIFQDIATLKDFGVGFRKTQTSAKSLSFESQGVSVTVLQGGVTVPDPADLGPATAEASIEFNRQNSYRLRTPDLKGTEIDNLRDVAAAVKGLADWKFGDYFIVWKLLSAKDFAFLANTTQQASVKFSGSGSAILKFLTSGLSAGVSRTSSKSMALEITGKGGPIAIGAARIDRNGRIKYV